MDDTSSLPTNYESFLSQQTSTMEDGTIDLDGVDLGHEPNHDKDVEKKDKKRKRKAPSKTRKTVFECWNYFDAKYEPDENGVITKMAYCKWCPAVYKADSVKNGTVIKKSLIKLIIQAELPFKFVEHPAFIEFSTNMQPRFNLPSHFTIARDVSKFYLEERKDLVNFLSNSSTTVHLTTDTWTSSCKRMNFMVLTTHFINDDWVMHKRIINFRPIHSHRGVDISRALLECINGWGIKNVMTMTVDNIASNDKALEYLLENLPTKYDDGKHFHVRCMAHILNLVVKDGLKAYKKEVDTIALAVKYIKHSSQRVTNFKKSVENACASSKFLISECPTRWNSTHDMLKTAIELKDTFFYYGFNNSCFARDLEEIPKRANFEVCKKVVEFLEKFKETTELVSSVSSPVAHLWFGKILDIDKHLREWQEKASFTRMISKMRPKKWLYTIPIEVDEESEETPFQFLTDGELCDKLVKKVEKDMRVLFAMYKEKYGINVSSDMPKSTSSQTTNTSRRRGNAFLNSFKDNVGNKLSGGEDELTKCLKEPHLDLDDDEVFDILNWWKLNSPRFPIVSRMAKDILSIQVSTVASESAFSASGRILDPYRNALAPNIVEALVCTQDWIRTSTRNITMDTLEDLMKDDELAKEI
ncbi:zinc finger BED domain-containing protein RICESLEEPER 2 [Tanacetum coccineum]